MRLGPFLRKTVSSWFRRTSSDVGGGVLITFALTLPVLMMIVGATIDYGYLFDRKTRLQAAADAAALAAASELHIANTDKSQIPSVAETAAMANLNGAIGEITVAVQVIDEPLSVVVELLQTPGLLFMGNFTGTDDVEIKARAVASVVGGDPICVLSLTPADSQAIMLQSGARLTGNECAVYSNSTHSKGIMAYGSSLTEAELICSGGGYMGNASNFDPQILSDCPAIEDPLIQRPPPSVGSCTHTDLEIDDDDDTILSPGVYCGGLTITGEAEVELQPGIYVMKDGPLSITGQAQLTGESVGFYLVGDTATLLFSPMTSIELTAPTDGPMAGLLVFEDRDAPLARAHIIRSDDARLLIGTFYFPQGDLQIDTTRPVADRSAYTAIVARKLKLFSGPHLVLNTDYGNTDVPVPDGLGGQVGGKEVVLAE